MSLESLVEEKQIVDPISSGRTPDGKFAAKNQISVGNGSNAGYARPSRRLESIINTSTVGQVLNSLEKIKDLNCQDAMLFHKLKAAAFEGDIAATSFVFDKLEPKEEKQSGINVNVNNSVANQVKVDSENLLMGLSEKITETE